MNVSTSPTISQMLFSMNNPQTANFNVGTALADANSGGSSSVQIDASSSMTSVGTSSGGGIDVVV